jgi:hypothetical protein
MAKSVTFDDVDVFLDSATWAICSTYHTVLKASPGEAIFGWDMLFDIPFVADWHKIGEHRQSLTNSGNMRENNWCIDYNNKVGDKVLVEKIGILCKAESKYGKEPWTITTLHTNGTIRSQCGTILERLNIQKVTPFSDKIVLQIVIISTLTTQTIFSYSHQTLCLLIVVLSLHLTWPPGS